MVFSLGYSHPIEYPLPSGITVAVDPKNTKLDAEWHRSPEGRPGCRRNARTAQARSVQAEGRALRRREVEEEGRQDGCEIALVEIVHREPFATTNG